MRNHRAILFSLLSASLIALAALGQDAASRTTSPSVPHRRTDGTRGTERQREGTRLTDVVGSFELGGDRVTFHPANEKESYRLLENLALERVGQVLGESRARHEWTVSGVLTEYRGSNYLLLQKAVIKSGADAR